MVVTLEVMECMGVVVLVVMVGLVLTVGMVGQVIMAVEGLMVVAYVVFVVVDEMGPFMIHVGFVMVGIAVLRMVVGLMAEVGDLWARRCSGGAVAYVTRFARCGGAAGSFGGAGYGVLMVGLIFVVNLVVVVMVSVLGWWWMWWLAGGGCAAAHGGCTDRAGDGVASHCGSAADGGSSGSFSGGGFADCGGGVVSELVVMKLGLMVVVG
jgi:hypothetical protein